MRLRPRGHVATTRGAARPRAARASSTTTSTLDALPRRAVGAARSVAYAKRLIRVAHRHGLAAAQKNTVELNGRRLGFDARRRGSAAAGASARVTGACTASTRWPWSTGAVICAATCRGVRGQRCCVTGRGAGRRAAAIAARAARTRGCCGSAAAARPARPRRARRRARRPARLTPSVSASSPDSYISVTMSQPPTSSPLTNSWGIVGQFEMRRQLLADARVGQDVDGRVGARRARPARRPCARRSRTSGAPGVPFMKRMTSCSEIASGIASRMGLLGRSLSHSALVTRDRAWMGPPISAPNTA